MKLHCEPSSDHHQRLVASRGELAAGLFDESAPREKLLEAAIARAARYAELPRAAFATIKRQLKGPAIAAIESALREGREPLRDNWISAETVAAATRPR